MAKIFPSKQYFFDLIDQTIIGVTRFNILTATSDHMDFPDVSDIQFLHGDRTTSDPTFYMDSNKNTLNIDGATAGTEYIVVSRHEGSINYGPGKGVAGSGL